MFKLVRSPGAKTKSPADMCGKHAYRVYTLVLSLWDKCLGCNPRTAVGTPSRDLKTIYVERTAIAFFGAVCLISQVHHDDAWRNERNLSGSSLRGTCSPMRKRCIAHY